MFTGTQGAWCIHTHEDWACPPDLATRRALVTFSGVASGAEARLWEDLEHLLRGAQLGERAPCDSPYQLCYCPLFLGLFPRQLVLQEGSYCSYRSLCLQTKSDSLQTCSASTWSAPGAVCLVLGICGPHSKLWAGLCHQAAL